ncbi:LLM class flavin-dependent oxidoreductase, partial [Streptomyces sp. NPDC001193]
MELSMMLDYAGDPRRAADEAAALEAAGLDAVWVAEAWGFDSPTIMGYLAARTERMKIGSAILNVYSRTPALVAQTAAGLDAVSGRGRMVRPRLERMFCVSTSAGVSSGPLPL